MTDNNITNEQWLPMKEIAAMLNISYDKLGRLVRRKEIRVKYEPLDQRVKLVELNEVKRMFKIT